MNRRSVSWLCIAPVAALLFAATRTAEAKAYKGAEVYSLQSALYGRIELRMRMIRGSSLISTFFTYKNGSELSGSTWEELDVEALGKNDAKTWQSNLITGNPRITSEQVHTSPTSLADTYHTYTLEWTPEYASWAFDGVVVRKTEGGQVANLSNPASFRFNAWSSESSGWAGALDEKALPAYQFVNWIKYYRYDNGQFVLDWTDEFDTFDTTRWATANWTFDTNRVDFDPANVAVRDSTLILAITKEGATGFSGTVPPDDGTITPPVTPKSDEGSGCSLAGEPSSEGPSAVSLVMVALGLATVLARRRGRKGLTLAAVLVGGLVPRIASATQGAELYRSEAYRYGRFEARVRYAPGEGVVSSFFLWKDGSSATTSWNELDFEKINGTCRMQTNIWTAKGTQSAQIHTPPFDLCAEYHTYTMEWTPDYISWLVDGTQLRKVTGAAVTEYTQNAAQGMTIHFNLWPGDSTFGGVLNPSTLPVYQYVSWVQYSSYVNGAFQMQWREDFNGSALPAGWATGDWSSPLNQSKHNPANVRFVNGIAVLAMTADNATGYTGTPPADPMGGGTGGAPGTGGAAGTGEMSGSDGARSGRAPGVGGSVGTGGRPGTGGGPGTGGANPTGGTGGSGPSSGGSPGSGGALSTGGAPGTGGALGSGGTPNPGTGGAIAASGGTSGTGDGGWSTEPGVKPGSDSGCSCRTASDSPTGGAGVIAAFVVVASAFGRARRRNERRQ
jgi:endo-1,3-1,4-beta-glycanase ExoK